MKEESFSVDKEFLGREFGGERCLALLGAGCGGFGAEAISFHHGAGYKPQIRDERSEGNGLWDDGLGMRRLEELGSECFC